MKNLDLFSQRFLVVSLSLMGLILCATLFVATVTPANANQNLPFPSNTSGASENGRYMMNYTSVHVPSQDKTYYECMVWDTKTGVSKLYYYDYSSKKFVSYEDNVQLPRNPLSGN